MAFLFAKCSLCLPLRQADSDGLSVWSFQGEAIRFSSPEKAKTMPWTHDSCAPVQPLDAAFVRSKLCHLAHGRRSSVLADAMTESGSHAAVAERDLGRA